MKVLISGAAGHLGLTMVEYLSPRHEVHATTGRELDVCNAAAVRATVERERPDAIVNCAAYTNVDHAEDDAVAALEVNAFAVKALASAATDVGAALVHFSTDFVFDGSATSPYTEEDVPSPRSAYAASKLIGEWFACEVPRHYVLRVESLFGRPPAGPGARRTSVDRIVDAILAGDQAPVFVDRTVSPSYVRDVCAVTELLLERQMPSNIYHCVNSGFCTWYELGLEVARQLHLPSKLQPVLVADAGLRVERPRFCALSSARLAAIGLPMPEWREGIAHYLRARGAVPDSPGARVLDPLSRAQ